jgi:hypothetical protein
MVETAAHLGVIAFIHRLGSSLNGQIHFHVCVVDGVFEEVAGEGDWATDWDGAAHCGGGSARYGLTAGAARVSAWHSKARNQRLAWGELLRNPERFRSLSA